MSATPTDAAALRRADLAMALLRLVSAVEHEQEDGVPRKHSISVNMAMKNAREVLRGELAE